MMILVEDGEDYRIFSDYKFGIIPHYILEDSSNAVQKQGTWMGVKITNHYFKSLSGVRKLTNQKGVR